MKLYQYTILKQDGTKEELPPQKKMDFDKVREILKCRTIEFIPKDYHPSWIKGFRYVMGDENAGVMINMADRVNYRNPHMEVLTDMFGEEWDVIGDLLLEQTYKEPTNV